MQNWSLISFFFSIFSSGIPLDFHKWIQVVLPNYLMYSLAGINTKELCNFPEKKDFAPLRVLNLFIKSFVNPFVDIALRNIPFAC